MDHRVSRRGVLAGLGAGAGLGVLGAGLPAGIAGASQAERRAPATLPATLLEQATPLNPALRYVLLCGHDFSPLESPSSYTTLDGQFRFLATSSGYASVLPNLPLGSVIKELEMYGTRAATGAVFLQLWKSTVADGSVQLTAEAVVPVVAGNFTTTVASNDTQDADFKSTPFVFIDSGAAPGTRIFGMRVGYVPPAQGFVPLSPIPRVLDTRTSSLGKLNPNEERPVALTGVPGFAKAAVINLTITDTEGAGYIAVFAANVPWPGNSNINWSSTGQILANSVITAIDPTGTIKIHGGVAPTHVVIDVQGYFL